MAEAIGLALTIVSIVKVSGMVLSSCYEYIGKVKNAPNDVQRIISEVGSLKSILEDLQSLISDHDDSRLGSLKSLEGKYGPFEACTDVLKELEKRLDLANASTLRRKLIWPFEGDKLDEILESLEKHKTTFILALAGDTARVTLATETAVGGVRKQLDDMKTTEQRSKLLQWLKGADPTTNHNSARRKHQPGTGVWLLNAERFQLWKDGDCNILWLHGIPGAGKTVLSSTIIDHLSTRYKSQQDTRIAYYYFDFSDSGKQTSTGCLQSLVRQLCDQSDVIPVKLQSLHADCNGGTPSLPQLTDTLVSILSGTSTDYIVIDALDECKEEETEREREAFFDALKEIKSSASGQYKILITSRPEPDIKRELTELGAIASDLQQDVVDEDIRAHVCACLGKDARFKNWPQPVKKKIEDRLAKEANGMFRWAVCQLDSLRKCLKPANALRELDNLPRTLEDTYTRIFKKVPRDYEGEMRSVLMLLAFSTRPMTIQEVADATAVNLETQSFSPEERFPDPCDLLELCSSLVSLTNLGADSGAALKQERRYHYNWSEDIKIIQFAHFSVKEYILSEGARKAMPSELFINASLSHRYITEMCLIYLLDFNGGKRAQNIDHGEFPFLGYTALHWTTHMALVPESDRGPIQGLLIRLFDTDNPSSLMNYLNLYDPVSPWHLRETSGSKTLMFSYGRRNRQDFETPLYYACYHGLLPIAEALLGKQAANPRSTEELGIAVEAAASGGHVDIVRRLLKEGADPNVHYCKQFYRPLQAAASSGSTDTVELLLAAGADVAARGGEFDTALHVAAKQGSPAVIQVLIDNGHEINPLSRTYGTALTMAARYGSDDAIAVLLRNGADPNIQGGGYSNALTAACEFASVDSVKILLDAGAVISRQGRGNTPLHAAAERGNIDIMRLLIARGADVNEPGGTYGTPLKAAIQADSNRPEALQLMLDNGADINGIGSTSKYPVDQAIFGGNIAAADKLLELQAKFSDAALEEALDYHTKEYLVKILLDRGADPNAERKRGGNMLQLAINGCKEETIRWLLEAGADVDAVEGKYGTALQAAVARKEENIVRLLLDYGAQVNPPSSGRYGNPLQAAINYKLEPIVQLLLDRGADVNARGGECGTPLQAAAEGGLVSIVRLLLKLGADINVVGGEYGTALRAALAKGHEHIARLLLENHAEVGAVVSAKHTTASNAHSILSFDSSLEVAAASNNTGVVQLLLDHDVDINADGDSCASALWHATSCIDATMLEFLITKGANVKQHGGKALCRAVDMPGLEKVRLLLQHGADVNFAYGTNGSALQRTTSAGGMEIMHILLDAGADVNVQGGNYGTALNQAIEHGSKDVVMELLGRGADVNLKAGIWGTALAQAAFQGDEEIFHELLNRGADVNAYYGYCGTALQTAIYKGYYDMAHELLNRNADANAPGMDGSPLIAASGHGKPGQLELMKRLVSLGADLEAQDQPREESSHLPGSVILWTSALEKAAYFDNEPVAQYLIELGANVNAQGGTYGNALQAAAKCGHRGMAKLLLDNGADVNALGGKFGTALQAAAAEGYDSVVDLLLEECADVNIEGGIYGSPLQAVSRLGKIRHVNLFLERGAKVNTNSGKFGSPLQAAAKRCNPAVVKVLLDHGADVNLEGGKHGNALQAAMCCHNFEMDSTEIVKMLLEHGAEVNKEGGKYGSALEAAAYHHRPLVEMLLKHGADPNAKGGKHGSPLNAAKANADGSVRVIKLLKQYGARESEG